MIFLFCCTTVFSQTASYFDNLYHFYENHYFKRIADFYIRDISFGLGTSYDSNFFDHPYLIETDNSIRISTRLEGAYLFKDKIIFETLPIIWYDNYFNHPDYNQLNRNLVFNLYYKLNHRMLFSGHYTHNVSRLRLYDTFGDIALMKRNSYGMEVSYETARGVSIHFNYHYNKERVSGELMEENISLGEAFSRNEAIFGIDFRYKFKAKSFISLSLKRFLTDFIYSDKRNANGYNFSLGLRFPKFGYESKINGDIIFGVKTYNQDYYNKNYVEWIGKTNITYASGHFKYSLILSRDFSYQVWHNSPVINTYLNAMVDYYFSKKLFAGAGYSYGRLDFKEPFIIGWERIFVRADYGTPILRLGIKTFYDYWITLSLSFSSWDSDQYYYYDDKNRTFLSISIMKL